MSRARLAALARLAAMQRDADLARLADAAACLSHALLARDEFDAALAREAAIACSSADIAVHRAFHAHALQGERVRPALESGAARAGAAREAARVTAAQSFGRALALERLAGRAAPRTRDPA